MLAAPKKENSLNRTKYKTHTESNEHTHKKAIKLFKTQMPTLQISQSYLLTHGDFSLPVSWLSNSCAFLH